MKFPNAEVIWLHLFSCSLEIQTFCHCSLTSHSFGIVKAITQELLTFLVGGSYSGVEGLASPFYISGNLGHLQQREYQTTKSLRSVAQIPNQALIQRGLYEQNNNSIYDYPMNASN